MLYCVHSEDYRNCLEIVCEDMCTTVYPSTFAGLNLRRLPGFVIFAFLFSQFVT